MPNKVIDFISNQVYINSMPRVVLTSALEICGKDLPNEVVEELAEHDRFLDQEIVLRKLHMDPETWPKMIKYLKDQQLWLGNYHVIIFSSQET